MQRYFIKDNQINGNTVSICDSDFHHIKNVMRLKVLQEVIVSTYSGNSYLTEIQSFTKREVILSIKKALISKDNTLNVTLAQALVKRDKFELVLQKVTELGVKEIIPLKTKNSVIKIDNFEKKKTRYQTIVKEASEQSERSIVPIIGDLTEIKNIDFSSFDYAYTAYARNESSSLLKEISLIDKKSKVLLLIGPEGGFSKAEIEYLESTTKLVSLGNTILRSETAAIYLVSAFRLIWEN